MPNRPPKRHQPRPTAEDKFEQLKQVMERYCSEHRCFMFVTEEEVEGFRDGAYFCYGCTVEGRAFIVCNSFRDGQPSLFYEVESSEEILPPCVDADDVQVRIGETIGFFMFGGMQSGVELEHILAPTPDISEGAGGR